MADRATAGYVQVEIDGGISIASVNNHRLVFYHHRVFNAQASHWNSQENR